ncbi:Hypothetical predicted protein, partial [Olea europaea subsp. europaea]
HWWDSMPRTRTPKQQLAITWEQFKEEVMDKYFPQSLRDFKENKFLQLKQVNMSLTDYERKFDQLSRYAPHLVNTKIKKTRRFEQGLNPDLSIILMSHRFTLYREMLEQAHAIWYQKANAEQHLQLYNHASKAMVATVAPCPKCGKPHRGECLYGKNAYFWCGKSRHIARDCPTFAQRKDDNNDQNKKGKARVFTLTQKDAEGNSNVITGILLAANTPTYILFDSGATHSFVSTSFIAKSSITWKTLEANLYMIYMKDFDVILGMDWLGCNYATIRCRERE